MKITGQKGEDLHEHLKMNQGGPFCYYGTVGFCLLDLFFLFS